jgi:hypothetical protein
MFDAAHDDAPQRHTPSDPMIEIAERHLRLLAGVAGLICAHIDVTPDWSRWSGDAAEISPS